MVQSLPHSKTSDLAKRPIEKSDIEFRVLIVDDESDFVVILQECMAEFPVHIEWASTLAECDTILVNYNPDILFLDYALPDGRGSEWLERHHEMLVKKSVAVFGISSHRHVGLEFLRSGAKDFIHKPIEPDEVTLKTRNELERVMIRYELAESLQRESSVSAYKDEVMRITAHDLRAPAGNIGIITELLLQQADMELSTMEMLEMLRTLSNEILCISENILKDGLQQASEDHVFLVIEDYSKLVQNKVLQYMPIAKRKNIELMLEGHFCEEPLLVLINKQKISRVLDNLLSNAIKYSPTEGTIYVSMMKNNGQVVLDVRDSGSGVLECNVPKLFKAFSKAGNVPTGGESSHGLGLYIANKIAIQHKGTLTYRNNQPTGSIFSLSLPMPIY
jgi:two-component system, sensor histidine kinase and response regulator